MKLHDVEISNFLSFRDTIKFKLSDRGLCLIVGYNNDSVDATGNGDIKSSNGAGKSALISSVLWGLYGKLDRDPDKKDMIINRSAGEKCCVTVRFDNCVVSRGRKPDFLRFWVDGVELSKGTVMETQKMIDEHIGVPFDVFKNSYVLSGETVESFMKKSKSQRREFLESIFNMSIFDDYLQKTRDKIKEHNIELVKLSETLRNIEELICSNTVKKNKLENDKNEWELTKDLVVAELNKELEKLQSFDLDEYRRLQNDIQKLDAIKQEYASNYKALVSESNKIAQEAQLLLSKIPPPICKVCGQKIQNYEAYKSANEAQAKAKQIESAAIMNKARDVKVEYENIVKKITSITETIAKKFDNDTDISIAKKIAIIKEKIESRLAGNNPYTVAVVSCVEELEKLMIKKAACENDMFNTKNKLETLSVCEKIFGADGIRKVFLQNIINMLNRNIDSFLQNLSPKEYLPFELDDSLNEVTGHYSTMSQGERRRVDVAIAISLMQIIATNNSCNILFLDEILDKLDPQGIEAVIDLLKSKCSNMSSVFLITHNSESKNFIDEANVVTIVKENGVSIIKGDKYKE